MRFLELPLAGAFQISLERRTDERGFFARAFCEAEFANVGLPTRFVQCNLSRNAINGTLRGMHFQKTPHEEGKVVRCVRGAIWDVIVDLRAGSKTQGRWHGAELTAENGDALYAPPGFAHGFVTLVDETDVFYQMSAEYVADAASGVRWNDPAFAIHWPIANPLVSPRDGAFQDWSGQ